jgi:hypothetical protein
MLYSTSNWLPFMLTRDEITAIHTEGVNPVSRTRDCRGCGLPAKYMQSVYDSAAFAAAVSVVGSWEGREAVAGPTRGVSEI